MTTMPETPPYDVIEAMARELADINSTAPWDKLYSHARMRFRSQARAAYDAARKALSDD